MHVLVTGGAGFIGSHFTEMALIGEFPKITKITVLDSLTYAGNLENLKYAFTNPNFDFIKGDICDPEVLLNLKVKIDAVINFAAESHVDRSIENSKQFILTNILGTQNLLEFVKNNSIQKFIQVSTDEVYGSINDGSWDENQPLKPNSPYAASKASADLIVLSYFKTHGLRICITRSSNNFGPKQHSEKLIPSLITRLSEGKKVLIYGDGSNIRDWLYVGDNCSAIYKVLINGIAGEIYNIGGGMEISNLELAKKIINLMHESQEKIEFIKDRLGHDFRYSVNYNKIKKLGYNVISDFDKNLTNTINWYLERII
jgi:dTDP-glucose 4,6-dehydratase